MVSVCIPACNEKFLQRTIDNVLQQSRGEIQVIAFLDGYWPTPPIKDDPRVTLIHPSTRQGMNTAINTMVRCARTKYIMKLDAHCILDEGFDVKLAEDCEDDWLVVPRRYSLLEMPNPEGGEDIWIRDEKRYQDYMVIQPPTLPPSPEPQQFWDRGFHGVRYWPPDHKARPEVDDLMTFQGSSYFMTKELYEAIDGLDFGYFWHEAQQIGVKVWMIGGAVKRNKKTWYAHLHKGKKHGRGYYISRRHVRDNAHAVIDLWMNDKWPKQKRKFRWLVEKFNPPGWENWDWDRSWEGVW